jgi:transcriptional regulator with XRE-family HTH domain
MEWGMLSIEPLKTRLKKCREASGITLLGLAEVTGLTFQEVDGYEKGKEPSLSALVTIGEAYGMAVTTLLQHTEYSQVGGEG